MSSSLPIFPSYDSGQVVDERLSPEKGREPFSLLGQMVDDSGVPSDEDEDRGRSNKTARSQRKISSEDTNAVICTTPTKAWRTERQETTPRTEKSSNDESLSEESPSCGAGMTDFVESLSSFMETIKMSEESLSSPHISNCDSAMGPSPDDCLQQQPPDFSLRDTEVEALLKQKKHMSFFAYGRYLTIASIVFALTGLTLSVVSKQSMSFVTLQNAIEISPQLNLVEHVGLVKMQLCYNETANKESQGRALVSHNSRLYRSLSVEAVPTADAGQGVNHHEQHGCFVLDLTVDTIHDAMWNVSRTFLSLAIAFGSFLTLMLCLAIYWESINLKPIALGMLVTYFFQSLSFFFFDSQICREYTCDFSEGSIASIFASLCWFFSALCCIRMDLVYQSEKRRWLRRRNRALKKIRLHRKASEATELSFPSTTVNLEDFQQSTHEPRNLTSLFDAEGQEWMNDKAADSNVQAQLCVDSGTEAREDRERYEC